MCFKTLSGPKKKPLHSCALFCFLTIASTTFVPEVSTTVSVPPSSSQSPMATETPQASSVINTYVPTTTQLISTTAHFHTSEPASSSTHTGVETTVMATADVTASTSLPSQNSATLSDSVMVTRTVDQTILVTPSASAASASARPTSSAALTQTHSPLSETLDQSSVLVSPTHTLDQASVLVSPTESDTFDQTIVVKPTSTDTVPPTVQHVHTQVSSTSSVDDHSWSADLSPSPSVLVHTSASGVQSSAMTSSDHSSSTPGSSSAENIMASIGAQVAHSPTLSTSEFSICIAPIYGVMSLVYTRVLTRVQLTSGPEPIEFQSTSGCGLSH